MSVLKTISLITAVTLMNLAPTQAAEIVPVQELPKLEQFPAQMSEDTSQAPAQPDQSKPVIAPKVLTEAEVKALLERLPPLPKSAESTAFAIRPSSEPPPKATATLQQPFPPPANLESAPKVKASGAVKVTRFAPQGEVEFADQISLAFDRPMVAVTTQNQTITEAVPVSMTPALEGHWRWMGTQVLVFEQKDHARLPMATEYQLMVAADTQAADGSRLAKPLQWTFTTPTLQLQNSYPSGEAVALNPLLFLAFNQRIEPSALLPFIQITVNEQRLTAHLATEEDIKADEAVAALVKQAPQGQALVLKLAQPLQTDSKVVINLAAQAPSAEGPREALAQNLYSFRTYAPLVMTEQRCGYERCTRYDTAEIVFNNPLAMAQNLDKLITVSPAPKQLEQHQAGDRLYLSARWQANTTYTVTVAPELKDQYGQTLSDQSSFSFKVEKSPASLAMTTSLLATLDPKLPAELPLYSTNYRSAKLTIQHVQPSDWPVFFKQAQALQHGQHDPNQPVQLPGKTVSQQTLTLNAEPDAVVTTPIALGQWLSAGQLGHLLVLVEPGEATVKPTANDPRQSPLLVWVQATQLGLDAYAYADKLLAWGGELASGKALANLAISLHSSTSAKFATETTDDQGLASLAYIESAPLANAAHLPAEPSIRWLEAKRGDDLAILPESLHPWSTDVWQAREQTSQTLWYVFDDRHLYRPKEEVHLKAWVRERAAKPASILNWPSDLSTLRYQVFDAAGNKMAEGETQLSGLGGFNLAFKLPDTPNLGPAQVQFKRPHSDDLLYSHSFEIQEFRTPEFEVKAELTNPAPYLVKQAIHLKAQASYYAGGGLAAAPVAWQLSAHPENYTPPNQAEWSFGLVKPVWLRWGYVVPQEVVTASFTGKTNAAGQHALLLQPNNTDYPLPISVRAEASITDVNRQTWTAERQLLIHPASTYVGLKTASYFVEQNQALKLELITVDIDGQAVGKSSVLVEAGLVDFSQERAGSQLKEVQRCSVQTDGQGLATCEFNTDRAGQYQITATTVDQEGRRNISRITRWVSGDQELPTTNNRVEMESAQIIPDKEHYAPNETAQLLIQAPFNNAEGLLLVNHNGLVTEQRFKMQGNSHTLALALKPEWLPNVNLNLSLVGQTVRRTADGQETHLPQRPAMASAELNLRISKAERNLTVTVQPQKQDLAPAEETSITVKVQNHQGQPMAKAEVALVVVDEAILTAGAYQLLDPLESFYPETNSSVLAQYFRASVLLPEFPEQLNQGGGGFTQAAVANEAMPRRPVMAAPVMAMGRFKSSDAMAEMTGAASPSIVVRTNFNPLAAFVPSLITDAQGQVTTTVKLPDNLTRYRIMAVAAQNTTHYGKGESHLTARKALMVRPSAPRFLNFGDSFDLPVVLQNQTDQPLAVQVALAANNLELPAAQGYALEIPANDRVELRFPAKTSKVGAADYQAVAVSRQLSDAATGSLPVWTPATSEAFATYGVIDQGAINQPVETPKQVLPPFGALKITTSSSALQSLTDAFIYLQNYPYSCSEQIASRILSTSALKEVLQTFKAKDLPPPEAIEHSLQQDLVALKQRQTPEGGFSLWGGSSRDWPYANVHVTHALVRAQQQGYPVDADLLAQSLNYLKNIDQYFPKDYSPEIRVYIQAYSLYVRQLVDDQDSVKAQALIHEAGGVNKLSTEAAGWLLNVLAADTASVKQREALRQELLNRVQETAAGASLRSELEAGDYWVMHSARAANGIVLAALIKDQPQSDLIPKLVKGLQNERVQGHWGTTQANAFILLALDDYFQQYEAQTPDFVAKAWLGNDFAGEHSFKGRTLDSVETTLPMEWLLQGEPNRDLVLAKQGEGRLYYRIGLTYAPASLNLAAAEQGFSVTRVYRGLDDPEDVKQDPDGHWRVKLGARIEVSLTMLAAADRHHVALVDALPAGFEAANPALAVTAQEPRTQPEPIAFSWLSTWYEHQNLRDERAEAFASILPGGLYTYRYIARATTPGRFMVPPAKAEEMYHPETFGRSASTVVVIE